MPSNPAIAILSIRNTADSDHKPIQMFWTEQSCLPINSGMKQPEQLGFGFEQTEEEKETAHLPSHGLAGAPPSQRYPTFRDSINRESPTAPVIDGGLI
jgi:hypothetical protein